MIKLLVLGLLATLVTATSDKVSPATTHPTTLSTSTKETTATTTKSTTTPAKGTKAPAATTTKSTTTPAKETKAPAATTTKLSSPTTPLQCKCSGGPNCHDGQCTAKVPENFCVTMAESNTLVDSPSSHLNHTCGEAVDLCNTTITITLTEHHYWRSRIACCRYKNNCNAPSLDAPPENTALSKLVCPSCFALQHSNCTPSIRKCAASETKCINVTGTVENGGNTTTFAGQGCATPSAASIKKGTTLFFGNAVYHFTSSTTKDATNDASQTPRSVLFTFVLSSFVALLQAKFIY